MPCRCDLAPYFSVYMVLVLKMVALSHAEQDQGGVHKGKGGAGKSVLLQPQLLPHEGVDIGRGALAGHLETITSTDPRPAYLSRSWLCTLLALFLPLLSLTSSENRALILFQLKPMCSPRWRRQRQRTDLLAICQPGVPSSHSRL